MIWIAFLTLLWVCFALVFAATVTAASAARRIALVATGIPCLGMVTWVFGPWVGLALLLCGTFLLMRHWQPHALSGQDPE